MFKLDAGNVLLKPSHRRQLMSWLKRTLRIGQRIKNLAITFTLHRVGKLVEIRGEVSDSRGVVHFRARQHDWKNAARDLIHKVTMHLHDQMTLKVA